MKESREKYNQLYKPSSELHAQSTTAEEAFEPVKTNAQHKAEKAAGMDFTVFISEFLTEMIGFSLVTGVADGLGNVIKGTGEALGDALSSIDL